MSLTPEDQVKLREVRQFLTDLHKRVGGKELAFLEQQPLGSLLVAFMNRFRDWTSPTGERFSNILVWELLMGKFSTSYNNFVSYDQTRTDMIRTTQQTVADLSAANADLTNRLNAAPVGAPVGAATFKTPKGVVLDVSDGPALDQFIDKFGAGVPVPVPPNPV